ncbi:MAG: hypothetical protein U5L09_20560 [Bacteroidales bacterium]|nr:hypothetical protein [Bacteroidales bacterium]
MASFFVAAQQEVPFTLEDRDRIIKLEERLNSTNERINSTNERIASLERQMNVKFEAQQKQIDDLKTMFTWGFSVLITIMLFILGYMIWDRRTAVRFLRENQLQQKIEIEKIKTALKEMGESDKKIAEILNRASLL